MEKWCKIGQTCLLIVLSLSLVWEQKPSRSKNNKKGGGGGQAYTHTHNQWNKQKTNQQLTTEQTNKNPTRMQCWIVSVSWANSSKHQFSPLSLPLPCLRRAFRVHNTIFFCVPFNFSWNPPHLEGSALCKYLINGLFILLLMLVCFCIRQVGYCYFYCYNCKWTVLQCQCSSCLVCFVVLNVCF